MKKTNAIPEGWSVSLFIKTLRTQANLSQQELADLCQVKRERISEYETGKKEPKATIYQTILNICGALISKEATPWVTNSPKVPCLEPTFFTGNINNFVLPSTLKTFDLDSRTISSLTSGDKTYNLTPLLNKDCNFSLYPISTYKIEGVIIRECK